jgi:hypothetical protein
MGIQEQDNTDRPQFARSQPDEVELRFWCPRAIVDVLDAVVMARGGQSANIHRGTVLVEEVGKGLRPDGGDLKKAAISHWEINRGSPNVFQLRAICERLNVSADYLIGINSTEAV